MRVKRKKEVNVREKDKKIGSDTAKTQLMSEGPTKDNSV